jgi:hypothetical protein
MNWRPATFPAFFAGDHGDGTRRGLIMWGGCWAVLRVFGGAHGLIHVPTGCRIVDMATEQAARRVAETIVGLTDWRSPLPAADPEIRAMLRRAIAAAAAADQAPMREAA